MKTHFFKLLLLIKMEGGRLNLMENGFNRCCPVFDRCPNVDRFNNLDMH